MTKMLTKLVRKDYAFPRQPTKEKTKRANNEDLQQRIRNTAWCGGLKTLSPLSF